MSKIETILTHPGGAHKDEFLACCILLAENPVPIFRREPSPEDLANPSTAVIDVGHTHTPNLHNFDHHQLPKDHPPTCSLSLVLQNMSLYEDARQFCSWLEPTEWFDCRGLIATAKWLGTAPDLLNKLHSPVDITLLRRFALKSRLDPGDPLWEIMRMTGEDLLSYIRNLRVRLDFIKNNAQIWTLDFPDGPAKILFLPRTEPLPEEPSMGLETYIENTGLTEIVGTVYPDRRSPGYGLSRFRDNIRLNFTRIADCPGVHFAHARGFVAKTSATEEDQLKNLMVRASIAD